MLIHLIWPSLLFIEAQNAAFLKEKCKNIWQIEVFEFTLRRK